MQTIQNAYSKVISMTPQNKSNCS